MELSCDIDNNPLNSKDNDKNMSDKSFAQKSCFYCNEEDAQKLNTCDYCRNIHYCSKDHQNIHLFGRYIY